MDGSQKLPQRIVAPLRARLEAGLPSPMLELAVAAWMAWQRGHGCRRQPHSPSTIPSPARTGAIWAEAMAVEAACSKLLAMDRNFRRCCAAWPRTRGSHLRLASPNCRARPGALIGGNGRHKHDHIVRPQGNARRHSGLRSDAGRAARAPHPRRAFLPLRAKAGMRFGSCFNAAPAAAARGSYLRPDYAALLERDCSILVPENEMKWQAIRPECRELRFRPLRRDGRLYPGAQHGDAWPHLAAGTAPSGFPSG